MIPDDPDEPARWRRAVEERTAAKKAEHARKVAEHNARFEEFWQEVKRDGWQCPGCGHSVYRLSTREGCKSYVICRTCGTAYDHTS